MNFTAFSFYGVVGSRERFIFKPTLPAIKSGIFFSFSELSVVSDFKLMNFFPSGFQKQHEPEF